MSNFHAHRDNLLSREQAEPLIKPYSTGIQTICLNGLDAANQFGLKIPELRAKMKQRTMSNILNDAIVHEARQFFDGKAGVRQSDEEEMFCVCIENRLAVRFKKSSDDDKTSNVKTHRQMDIASQFLKFPGWEDVTWVSVGYHLTKAGDLIDRIKIICRYFDEYLWQITI